MKLISKIFGWLFIAFGIILLLNGTGITGLTIFEDVDPKDSSIIGILILIIGILILKFRLTQYSKHEEDTEEFGPDRFRSQRGLRAHNAQAHYAARRYFMETHGRLPDRRELKAYTRQLHEGNDLGDVIEDRRHHKKSA